MNNARHESLKTMAILAMAAIIFGLLFRTRSLFYVALAFLVCGLFIPRWAAALSTVWLKFSHVVGAVNTRIVLGLIFYCLLTPIALVYRLTHGDFLGLKRQGSARTYFTDREHTYCPEDFSNPW